MRFCTVINCMDGRVQIPVIEYLKERFGVQYVDSITEAGPNLILGKQTDQAVIDSVFKRLKISIEKHGSKSIAIVGHYDCGGNPASQAEQIIHITESIKFLKEYYNNIEIIGLWVGQNWQVNEIAGSVDEG